MNGFGIIFGTLRSTKRQLIMLAAKEKVECEMLFDIGFANQ